MRILAILLFIISAEPLYSQAIRGYSDADALGSAQTSIGGSSTLQFLRQGAIPLEKQGDYFAFSSLIPSIQGLSKDFMFILARQNQLNAYRIAVVQSGNEQLKQQIFQIGLSRKIKPEIFMGIDLLFMHSGIPEYVSGKTIGSRFSMFYQLNDKIKLASSIDFFKNHSVSKSLANNYRVQASWILSKQIHLGVLSLKEHNWDHSIQSISIRFLKNSNYYIDLGSYLNQAQYCFGIGFKRNSGLMSFASSWKPYTGLQFSCSIQYCIERDRK